MSSGISTPTLHNCGRSGFFKPHPVGAAWELLHFHPFSLFGLTGPGDQIYKGHVGNNKRQEHTDGGVSQKNSHSYQQKFDEMKSEKLSTKRFCTSSRCVHTQGTRADKGQAGTKTPILRVCLPEVMPMKKRNCKD